MRIIHCKTSADLAGFGIGTQSQPLESRSNPQYIVVFFTILSLKNGTKGKPKIPLDRRPILGYFPAIVTHHSF